MPSLLGDPDTASLVARCRRGDAAAWEALIRRFRRLIYSIPLAMRLSSDEADEVFQRTTLALYEHLDQVRDPEKLASWLAVTARRASWALRREGARERAFEEGEDEGIPDVPAPVARELELVECEHALALALDRLGDPCRPLLMALHVEDSTPSYQELAERLGRPIGSLGPTRARCLEKLRKLYLAEGGQPPPELA